MKYSPAGIAGNHDVCTRHCPLRYCTVRNWLCKKRLAMLCVHKANGTKKHFYRTDTKLSLLRAMFPLHESFYGILLWLRGLETGQKGYIHVCQFHYITLINSCTGLGRPRGLQEFKAPSISRQSAHEDGKAVSPTHRTPLRQGKIPGNCFC